MAICAALYFCSGKLGLLLAIPPGYATAVWPPSGIALALVLILGPRVWPGIWLGSFLVNVWMSIEAGSGDASLKLTLVAASIGAGAALQALLGGHLVRRFVGYPSPLDVDWDIIKFTILGGPVSCVLNATVGVLTLLAGGIIDAGSLPFSWWTWWIGDTIGVLTVTPLVLILAGSPRHVWRPRLTSVGLPLCTTFACAVLIFVLASGWEQNRIRVEFERRAENLGDAVKKGFENHLEALRSLQSFFNSSIDVDRKQFRSFVDGSVLTRQGVHAVSWNPVVKVDEKSEFESEMRQDGLPGFEITEENAKGKPARARVRPEYVPAAYVEPQPPNEAVLGIDVAMDPLRAEAMSKARDTGQPVATRRLCLRDDGERRFGIVVFLPVYGYACPRDTLEERRTNLRGYIAGLFRVSDMVGAALRSLDLRGMELRLDDDGAIPEERLLCVSRTAADEGNRRLHSDAGKRDRAGLHWAASFNMGGRDWRLVFSPTPDYLLSRRTWAAWTVLAGGLLFTGLLGVFLLVLTGGQDRILQQVTARTAALNTANRQLEDEVEMRKKVEVELAVARDKALEASQAKSAFLANMSHEIRTPMMAILGYADLLLEPGRTQEETESTVQVIRQNSGHLLAILNDILDLSKIEAGKMTVERIPCSPIQVIADAVSLLRIRAKEKKLDLQVELGGPFPSAIQTDPTRLRQILLNLLGNALKFTEKGTVRLSANLLRHAESERPILCIEVLDSGIGMTAEQRKGLFQAFAQADSSTTRKYGGTGLGLMISQRLVRMLGGDLIVQTTLGEGTSFVATIDPGPLDGIEMLDDPQAALSALLSSKPATAEAQVRLSGRILIADDVAVNQRLFARHFEKCGASVETADNGRIAVEKALRSQEAGEPYDLILMDMQMPELDGYGAAAQLRAGGYSGPILALTASALSVDREKALLAGCNAYLSKPIDRAKLLKAASLYLEAAEPLEASST